MLKVAVFRPESRKKDVEVMKKLGFKVIHAPLLETEVDLKEVERAKNSDFDVAIVTSVTAVKIMEDYGILDIINPNKNKKVIAIGKKTAEALKELGIECELPHKFDSESIVKQFKDYLKGMKIALFRSDKGDPILLKIGDADEFKIYKIKEKHGKKQMETIRKIAKGEVDVTVFSSRMMVRSFVNLCKKIGEDPKILKNTKVIAIGPPTFRELKKTGIEAKIPEEYTFDGIIKLLKDMKNADM